MSKKTNDIIANYGDYLEIDISTPKFPDATMLVDTDVWDMHDGGRVGAFTGGVRSKYIYARHRVGDKTKLFHHFVLPPSEGKEIDHITHGDMSLIDNRRENIRLVTTSQNAMNRGVRVDSSTGIKGVRWHKSMKRWYAEIRINGKQSFLGGFDNIDLAVEARRKAEREYFGEFAYSGGSK